MSGAAMMVARVMLGHGYEPGVGLGKNNDGMANLVDIKENREKFGLGYKPTQTDVRRSIVERRSKGVGSQLRPQAREVPPCHISKSFVNTGLRHEEKVVVIYDKVPQERSNWVRPCLPDFQLGNSQVVERPEVSMVGTISDDESYEGTNTEDPAVDFKRELNWPKFEGDEGMEFPAGPEKTVTQEDREMKPHQEEKEVVKLGVGNEKKEVKVGAGMTTPIGDELVVLL